jgi:hydrogenase nickel incorporation protein HypA/HybF
LGAYLEVHELSMTTQIVESVLTEAKKHGAKKVTEVHLVIGKLTFLGIEQVRFAYGILTEDTILKGSKLVIKEKEGVIECPSCGYRGTIKSKDELMYHVPTPIFSCPECGEGIKIVEGRECTIESIKMVCLREYESLE